jgi:xanthine dehydrogenase YagS FAD-binding subunit
MTRPAYKKTDDLEIQKALSWLSKRWERPLDVEYFAASTLQEAVTLANRYGERSKFMAGGTDLVGLMKNKVISPGVLINLKTIPDLQYIRENNQGLEIGALTLILDLEKSDLLKKKYPFLREAASQIGSPQIRHMATVGGNLGQQVRCWYYRRPPDTGISFDCRRKKESGSCYAVNGENQFHAIFGGRRCWAVCPSDLATVLLALNAGIRTFSSAGERSIPLEDFYTSLGNSLKPDEIITGITLPGTLPETRQRFIKFRTRQAIDFATVSVAAITTFNEDMVSGSRVVLGGVSPGPYRANGVAEILLGKSLSDDLAGAAAKAAVSEAHPLAKNGYKVQIAEALVKRALLE